MESHVRSGWVIALALPLILGFTAAAHAGELVVKFESQRDDRATLAWLRDRFTFRRDGEPTAERQVHYRLTDDTLFIDVLKPASPILSRDPIKIPNTGRNKPIGGPDAKLTIEWGVNRYPVPNWITKHREAIMLTVLFGDDQPNTLLETVVGAPKLPYFIGFFLCKVKDATVYTGTSYTKHGRYRCVDSPTEGGKGKATILNLGAEFMAAFGKAAPPVTGFAIEADTTDLSDGRASAWIRAIKFSSPSP
jgi:hypothetical protein